MQNNSPLGAVVWFMVVHLTAWHSSHGEAMHMISCVGITARPLVGRIASAALHHVEHAAYVDALGLSARLLHSIWQYILFMIQYAHTITC